MLLEAPGALPATFDGPDEREAYVRWGVASETGRLTDVLLSAPKHLALIPCNAVTRASIAGGLDCTPALAAIQHRHVVEALAEAGVRCHFVPPSAALADLSFTRDAVLMSPWGLIELRPAVAHRRSEPGRVAETAAALGLPRAGAIHDGTIEGGDICLLRPGLLAIGHSGERTDRVGAEALAAIFRRRGWDVIHVAFSPEFLHLDTIFTMVSGTCAVAYTEALDDLFLDRLARLGIGVIPAARDEVDRLGVNLLSLGAGRILAPADNLRLNRILERSGFDIVAVDIDQFTRCGGGVHCLTMPLARERDREAG